MRRIFLRVDSGGEVGHGHFVRCFELACRLPQYAPTFVGQLDEWSTSRCLGERFLVLPSLDFSQDNYEWLSNVRSCDVVLFDSYQVKESLLEKLRDRKLDWGLFDDQSLSSFDGASFVINFRFAAEKWASYKSRHSFLGANFMPISEAFVALRKKRRNFDYQKNSIFICIGSRDIHSVSQSLLRDLKARDFEITLVSQHDRLFEADHRLKIVPPTTAIAALMESASLAITSGGRLKYESLFSLLPTVALSQTPLENEDTLLLTASELCVDGGTAWAYSSEKLLKALEDGFSMRASLLANSRDLFVDDPCENLAQRLKELVLDA
jgi:spore coat polysaccharide biosynthesis predicted glycosyltransferase SpsG